MRATNLSAHDRATPAPLMPYSIVRHTDAITAGSFAILPFAAAAALRVNLR